MKRYKIPETTPSIVSDVNVLYLINEDVVYKNKIKRLKTISKVTDDLLAGWLNISLKTFKNYQKSDTILKPNLLEHIILLELLYELGISVFGEVSLFNKWLLSPNFFLDNIAPASILNTISGIRLTQDRLIALEHGDNV